LPGQPGKSRERVKEKQMKPLHRVVAAGAVLAVGLCGWARAQVLEQVPSDAVGVFEVKDLQGLSTKVAKFAKSLGIDQFKPEFADPLGALQDQFDLKQGLNKDGDLAIAFFDKPKKDVAAENSPAGEAAAPPAVVLVPVSDYKAFLTNFKDVKDAGEDISEVTVPKNGEKLYVVQRDKYAMAAMDKALLHAGKAGLKLEGPAAKEAQSKDAFFYVDIQTLRPKMQKGIKEAHDELNKQLDNPNAAKENPFGAEMTPQMRKLFDSYFNAAEQIVKDGRSGMVSFNLTDTGIGISTLADFEPQSDLGKLVGQVQNTDQPLLAGLPDATYYGYIGAKLTPEVTTKLFDDFLEPMLKSVEGGNAADKDKAVAAVKDSLANMKSFAAGYAAKDAAPGQGLLSVVAVAHGDAHKMVQDQKAALPAMNDFMGMSGKKNSVDINFGEPKNVDGVDLQTYTVKRNFDPNDAQAAQAKQMLSILYGHDALTGVMGAATPDTFVSAALADDKLLSDLIAAAKKNQDVLDQAKGVQTVAADLPKQRSFEAYLALDNIATTAVKVAKQQGLPVQFKLPANLPPIGLTGGTDGSTARFDLVIPTQLIQSITAAGMQAVMQQQGGGGGGI
jgi:hypothetical protein